MNQARASRLQLASSPASTAASIWPPSTVMAPAARTSKCHFRLHSLCQKILAMLRACCRAVISNTLVVGKLLLAFLWS